MNVLEIQCITEGLQIDKASTSTKIQSQMDKTNDFYMENRHLSALRISLKHLMCTFSKAMVLVRNLEQVG